MKKLLTAFIACFAFIVIFSGCGQSPKSVLLQTTGLNIPECEYVTTYETHGGFHGDGYTYYIFTFSEQNGKTLENTVKEQKNWRSTPFDKTVNTLIYNDDEHHYCQCDIPVIENGFYFFYDKQNDSYYPADDYLENSYSYNFVISIYDCDNYLLYYYELDT